MKLVCIVTTILILWDVPGFAQEASGTTPTLAPTSPDMAAVPHIYEPVGPIGIPLGAGSPGAGPQIYDPVAPTGGGPRIGIPLDNGGFGPPIGVPAR
jgi:hypothetical protein